MVGLRGKPYDTKGRSDYTSVACGVDTLEPVCSRYVVEHRIIRLVRNEVRKHTVRKYGIQSTWFGFLLGSRGPVRVN